MDAFSPTGGHNTAKLSLLHFVENTFASDSIVGATTVGLSQLAPLALPWYMLSPQMTL